jgi:uncharacterized protein YjbI with pentapeptide repeats
LKVYEIIGMKLYSCLFVSAVGLWCGSIAYADALGSLDAEIQKNFNKLITTKECPRCDLSGTVLTRVDLTGADLEGANLSGAKLSLTNFSKANLRNADLRGANLGGADFAGADLRGADLTGAMLEGAYFKEALLEGELIREKPYEPEDPPEKVPDALSDEANQVELNISDGEDIANSDFSRTEQAGDKLERHELDELDDAEIQQPPEKKSTTVTSKFLSPMAEAVAPGSAPTPSQMDYSAVAPQISTPRVLEDIPVLETGSDKQGAKVSGEGELSVWDTLTSLFGFDEPEKKQSVGKREGGDLQQPETPVVQHPIRKIARQPAKQDRPMASAQLKPSTVDVVEDDAARTAEQDGKNREAATKQQAVRTYTVETAEQAAANQRIRIKKLLDENRCVACDLAGANLAEEDLEGADLERADLRGTDFEGADLSEANLKGTNFNSANLKNADLREADLYLASFANADLTGAKLEGALIDSTDFTGAVGLNSEGAVEEE